MCTQINFCRLLKSAGLSCGGTSRCTNMVDGGGYACDCADGWLDNGPNTICTDKSLTCNGTGQLGGPGSCDCKVGYTGNPKWNMVAWDDPCEEIDECVLHNVSCGGTATCVDGVNSYRCDGCDDGWRFDAVNRPCADVDECAIQRQVFRNECGAKDGANTCHNGRNTFSCTCGVGWEGGGERETCTEVDECVGVVCGGASRCIDHVGAFFCKCGVGWEGGGFNKNCTLITRCDADATNCGGAPNQCTDRLDGFVCTCASGFQGGGVNTSCAAATTPGQPNLEDKEGSNAIWQHAIVPVAAGTGAVMLLVTGALVVVFVVVRRRRGRKASNHSKVVVAVTIPLMPSPQPKNNAFMV